MNHLPEDRAMYRLFLNFCYFGLFIGVWFAGRQNFRVNLKLTGTRVPIVCLLAWFSSSCGMPVCIDTSVKLFVFLFVSSCGVSLSAGSLIDTMTDLQSSANPSTNASANVTEDTCFSIQFRTKPCEEKQKNAIEHVTSYFTNRANTGVVHTAIKPGSNSQNDSGWCLNVFVRAVNSFNKNSARRAMRRTLSKAGRCGFEDGDFTIYVTACYPSQSRVLDQSDGQDPSVYESKNLTRETTFAAALASGTHSGIQDSGDQ